MTKSDVRPTRTLKDLRALNAPLDNDGAALALPEPPPYRHPCDETRPQNPVQNVGELVEWCREQGHNPAPAIGHAMCSAIRLWAKALASRQEKAMLTKHVASATARLTGAAGPIIPSAEFQAFSRLSGLWQANGQPLIDYACAETQRRIIVLTRAAARRAAKAVATDA